MITIAGGTGRVGAQVTTLLLRSGACLRVLTRDPQRTTTMFADAALEIVGVDFDAPATIERALKGSDQVFQSMGTSDRQVRDEIALIDAAVAAGVSHVVELSVGGAGGEIAMNVLEWHTEIDAYLSTQDVVSTIVRPATYTQALLGFAAAGVRAGAWGGSAGSGRVSLVDTRDVAAVAAAILLEGPGPHRNKVYEVTGPAAVTMQDVAQLISEQIGTSVEYELRSVEKQRSFLEGAGLPPLYVEVLLGLDYLTRENLFAVPNTVVFELTGKLARSVDAWVGEHRADFLLPAPA